MTPLVRFARDLVWQRGRVLWYGYRERDAFCRLNLAEGRHDPYGLYREIRARGPLVPTRVVGHQTTSHALCRQVLRDRRFGVDIADSPVGGDGSLSLLEMDPPDHTRLRRLVTPAFSPRAMAGFAPRITAVVDRLLDAVPADGRFDLVTQLASPLPIAVVTDLLGVPDDDSAAFARYGVTIGSALAGPQSPLHVVRLLHAFGRLNAVVDAVLETRRRAPAGDLASALVAAEGDGEGQVRPDELRPLALLLLLAGFETTVNLIGNTVLALLDRPALWRAMVDDPELVPLAVEETLRWDAPVQRTARAPSEPVELAGVPLAAGEVVVLLLAAANRDPEAFDDPDIFDPFRWAPDRPPGRRHGEHLAFSAGSHYCVGAPLARLEAVLAVRRLVERFPRLHRVGPVRRRPGTVIRGPASLPLAA